MSCLPSDALSHFEQREQELLAINRDLELKRAQAVAEASSAVQGAAATAEAASAPGLLRQASARIGAGSATRPVEHPVAADGGAGGDALRLRLPSSEASAANSLLAGLVGERPLSGACSSGLPGAGGGAGSDALHTTIRFQSARIVALQEELDKTLKELAARDRDGQRLEHENKQAQDEIARLQKAAVAAEKQRETLKTQSSTAEAKAKDLEREKSELVKERGEFDLQQRRAEAEGSAKEARMNRLIEENEKFKAAIRDAGSQDKDRAAADRRECERLQGEVRKLERQRAELVNAFKKQMKLIEVLKRQRAHMEAARVLSFTEEEFIRVLELGDKLGE